MSEAQKNTAVAGTQWWNDWMCDVDGQYWQTCGHEGMPPVLDSSVPSGCSFVRLRGNEYWLKKCIACGRKASCIF